MVCLSRELNPWMALVLGREPWDSSRRAGVETQTSCQYALYFFKSRPVEIRLLFDGDTVRSSSPAHSTPFLAYPSRDIHLSGARPSGGPSAKTAPSGPHCTQPHAVATGQTRDARPTLTQSTLPFANPQYR